MTPNEIHEENFRRFRAVFAQAVTAPDDHYADWNFRDWLRSRPTDCAGFMERIAREAPNDEGADAARALAAFLRGNVRH